MGKKQWKDVLHIVSGKNQKAVENPDGKYPIYGSGGLIGYADDYLCEAGTTIVGRKGTINRPIFVTEPFWNIDTAFGIVPDEELDPKYLYYFCVYFNFMPLDKSTGRPSLAKSDLLKIEMPVPPLEEQQRIVARIEELFSQLDDAEATLQKAKAQLTLYRQAVLKEAFQGKEQWDKHTFNNLLSGMRNGYGEKPTDSGDYKILRISAVRPLVLNPLDYRMNQDAFTEENLIQENDLLFTRYNGSQEYVGVCARVPSLDDDYAYPDKIIRCRLKQPETILAKYLMYYLNSGDARKYIRSKIKTTSGQKGIAGGDIKKTIVYIPDSIIQGDTVKYIESNLSSCDSIERTIDDSIMYACAIRKSILKQAFEVTI